MSFWTMIAVVVALGVVSEMYRARLKANQKMQNHTADFEQLAQSLQKLEERMANLETIVLEGEKHRRFERELGGIPAGVPASST